MTDYIQNEITVIMTVWKRNNYRLQLEHIKSQSHVPHQIWIYQNESHVNIDISDEEKEEYNISIIQSKDINFKFHGRFVLPLLCDTEYCAIFDDDTIPSRNWLSHALTTSREYNCIIGANGRTLLTSSEISTAGVGDGKPVTEDTKVDFVGHCWFFKTDWCRNMWRDRPFTWDNGEDIHLAASCYLYEGIECFVPHTLDSSTRPDTMYELGTDDVATWRTASHGSLRQGVLDYWLDKGWRPICVRS